MELAYFIAFVGGMALGLVLALALCSGTRLEKTSYTTNSHDPILQIAACQAGQVTVTGSGGTPPAGGQQVAVYAVAYPSQPIPLPSGPPSGTPSQGGFPVTCTAVGSNGYVVVWVEYRSFGARSIAYSCSGGSGSSTRNRFLETINSEAVDALPKNFSVAPAHTEPGKSTGPVAELVGALTQTPEPVLRYVAEASTPAEPLWRAIGGPQAPFEATLVLLHRSGGVGAVLTVGTEIAGRRVQFTWVTSNWSFHAKNRLRCESDEPGLPALVVGPA